MPKFDIKECLLHTFPIAVWIQEYQFKRDFPMDFIAGTTVTVLQIPQGIAYGHLANVPSICGLYTAFFTSFCYIILGTSRHLNIGTFSIICLMTGHTVSKHATLDEHGKELDHHPPVSLTGGNFKNIDVLSATTFLVAMYMTTYEICKNIPNMNYVTFGMSAITMVILGLYQELIKDRLAKKCKIPIPMELIAVTAWIIVTFFLELHTKYQVDITGPIPTGLPYPMVPNMNILQLVAFDAFSIAMISYILTISFGFIFARKGSYEINPNQECLALGMMNLVGCFFQCVPVSASATRTLLQYNVGMVSQICTLVSSILLLLVLLFMASLMEYTPKGVLAAIIILSVYRMLCQMGELKNFWLSSKLDVLIWFVTFAGTLVIGIRCGLLLGVAVVILVIIYRYCCPNSTDGAADEAVN